MTTMNSSIQHIESCLTKLRLKVRCPRMSTHDMAAQNRAYAEDLAEFSPRSIARACEEWAKSHGDWPSLSSLLEIVRENEALSEGYRKRIAPPSDGAAELEALNECLLLSVEFDKAHYRFWRERSEEERDRVLSPIVRWWMQNRPMKKMDEWSRDEKREICLHLDEMVKEATGREKREYAKNPVEYLRTMAAE